MTDGTVLDVSAITDLATQRTAVVLGRAVDRGEDVVVPAAAWLDAWGEASPASIAVLAALALLAAIEEQS